MYYLSLSPTFHQLLFFTHRVAALSICSSLVSRPKQRVAISGTELLRKSTDKSVCCPSTWLFDVIRLPAYGSVKVKWT